MADNFNYVQLQDLYLAGSGIGIADVTITFRSMQFPDGTNVAMTDFGDIGYITLEPNTPREENISFTDITQNVNGTATVTGVTRGLGLSAPYTAVSGNRSSHSGGTVGVVSNSAPFYNELAGKDNDETVTGKWTFPAGGNANAPVSGSSYSAPTNDLEYATKKYIDDTAIAGGAKATTSVYGISKLSTAAASPTEPIVVGDNDPRLPTADEKAALAGTSGTPSTSNKYVTNDDTATTGASKLIRSTANSKIDDSLVGATTAGDIIYSDGTDLQRLAIGLEGQILKTGTGATAPAWGTLLVEASDTLQQSADTERSSSNDNYEIKKQINSNVAGTIRVKFDLKNNTGGGSSYGRIYINGTAVGTERITASTSYVTYSEDVQVAIGDYIQIYIHRSSSSQALVSNFRLYFDPLEEVDDTYVVTD